MKKLESTKEQRESFEAKEKRLEAERQKLWLEAKEEVKNKRQRTLFEEY